MSRKKRKHNTSHRNQAAFRVKEEEMRVEQGGGLNVGFIRIKFILFHMCDRLPRMWTKPPTTTDEHKKMPGYGLYKQELENKNNPLLAGCWTEIVFHVKSEKGSFNLAAFYYIIADHLQIWMASSAASGNQPVALLYLLISSLNLATLEHRVSFAFIKHPFPPFARPLAHFGLRSYEFSIIF